MINSPADLRKAILETIAWCVPRATKTDPGHSLRTILPEPKGLAEVYDPPPRVPVEFAVRLAPWARERQEIVAGIVSRRASQLVGQDLRRSERSLLEEAGSFLLYDPDSNLSDGCAEMLSGGFFDVDNAPPWDTWIWYLVEPDLETRVRVAWSSYLVAWVPSELVDLADVGIDVNPERCIRWAGDLDTSFTRLAREAGIVLT
jgi:hypothetical protein